MAYCTYTEIQALTGSTLTSTDLEAIIAEADREIDAILAFHSLSGGTDGGIKSASIKLSLCGVITRGRMDGTRPRTIQIGDMMLSDDPDTAIKELRASALATVSKFVKKSKSTNVDNWVSITNE